MEERKQACQQTDQISEKETIWGVEIVQVHGAGSDFGLGADMLADRLMLSVREKEEVRWLQVFYFFQGMAL